MPLCTLHLITLHPGFTIAQFVSLLHDSNIKPLTLSRVIGWIITPTEIDTSQLLRPSPSEHYDLLLILPGTSPLPGPLESKLSSTYTLQIGIPSRVLKDFPSHNQKLLYPDPSTVPALTGSLSTPIVNPTSSQTLTLSPDLQTWISTFSQTHRGKNALSMLNLLSFHPDKKESYLKYGKAFAETIGSKRGGDAKLVGHVVYPDKPQAGAGKWDEFALAHYPSILHFADMLASRDYQEVNQEYRVPALRDTCILCTSEIEVEEVLKGEKAKL